jgi:hypothetical protein
MRKLEINKNYIKSIEYLLLVPLCHTLRVLNGAKNELTDLESTVHTITGLESLEMLDLYDNPISDEESYRFRLCNNKCIQEFDGIQIKGVVREGLADLNRDFQIDSLIKNTHQEYAVRIQKEKERNEMVANYHQRVGDNVKERYSQYRDQMNV